MDKTVNINLGGSLFQIDEEAYKILRDYLQAINIRFKNVEGGLETVEDIENRISEIFQSQKGLAGVITKENVEAMIAIIGKPEDFGINEGEKDIPYHPSHTRRLYRNPDDKIVSGVCGGLGAYTNTDPVIFRILFVIFTVFFGVGALLYIILWIALPSADSDAKKRELHGDRYHSHPVSGQPENHPLYTTYQSDSRVSNAFNEVFRAVGRAGYIILRIILIIFGVALVLTGFLAILSFAMIFIFKYPAVQLDGFDMYVYNITDFVKYIVNPSIAPWILVLSSIAFLLPMIAFIYWGVKMIFFFRARDAAFSLTALVLWVLSVAALAIILFNEGISFAESANVTIEKVIPAAPDTLYITAGKKVADLKYNKEFRVPDDEFNAFFTDSDKGLYIRPQLDFTVSPDKSAKVEVRKYASGRYEDAALRKAESLIYNFRISADTIYLDEYFSLPSGSKWSGDLVDIDLYVPENTVIFLDPSAGGFFHRKIRIRKSGDESGGIIEYHSSGLINKYWRITEDGLKEASKSSAR